LGCQGFRVDALAFAASAIGARHPDGIVAAAAARLPGRRSHRATVGPITAIHRDSLTWDPLLTRQILHHAHPDRNGAACLQPLGAGSSIPPRTHLRHPQRSGGTGSQVGHLPGHMPPEMQPPASARGQKVIMISVFVLVEGRKRRDSNPRCLSARSLSSDMRARSDRPQNALTCEFGAT